MKNKINNLPYLLYQNVDLDIDMISESINCQTVMWLGYSEDIATSEIDVIKLHCRQCQITSISINNIECEYTYNDGLKNIYNNSLSQLDNKNIDDIDLRYRAALEIAKNGELEIILPNKLPKANIPLIPFLNNAIPDNIRKQFEKLTQNYDVLSNILDDDNTGDSIDNKGRLFQVKILYQLGSKDDISTSYTNNCNTGGYIFKSPLEYIDLVNEQSSACCLYTVGGGDSAGSNFKDYDGVRCWLPCLDTPDQRCIFDITLRIPSEFGVVCSGSLIDTISYIQNNGNNMINYTSYRYMTSTRIAAFSLGFMVAKFETYTMSLGNDMYGVYKVPLGLQDYKFITNNDNCDINNDGMAPLYQNLVLHTTLGLDMGVQFLHRIMGHKYDHITYTQIFMPYLGSNELFYSFDGFSIVDFSTLQNEAVVYSESSSNLLQLNAYLYSYLKSGLPLDCYDSQFIIHGTIGYLLTLYIDHVYGEDDCKYRLQKYIDTVVEIEKLGHSTKLVNLSPESYSGSFCSVNSSLMVSKATVLMFIIENKLGGREALREAIVNLIKSPLYINESNQINNNANIINSNAMQVSINQYIADQTKDNSYYKSEISNRVIDENFAQLSSIEKNNLFESLFSCDCVSPESFISTLRSVAGVASDITVSILDRFVYDSGILVVRVHVTVDPIVLNKSRYLHVLLDPINKSLTTENESIKQHVSYTEEYRLRVVETLDSYPTETTIKINDHSQTTYNQIVRTRAGRKVGKKSDLNKDENLTDLERQELLKINLEKENRKPALHLSREYDLVNPYPIKYLILDTPYISISDMNLCGCDNVLVEQLFAYIDDNDIYRQIQSIRCLAKGYSLSSKLIQSSTDVFINNRNYKLQIKALSDSLFGVSQQKIKIDKSIITGSHCLYIRAEAAFSLAAWQNEHAPSDTSTSDELISAIWDNTVIKAVDQSSSELGLEQDNMNQWMGLSSLIELLQVFYVENVIVNNKTIIQPRYISLVKDISSAHLRNSALLALSTIKSKSNITPDVVVKILLLFSAHLFDFSSSTNVNIDDIENYDNVDDSYLKTILLMCLSSIKLDFKTKTTLNNEDEINMGVIRDKIIIETKDNISDAYEYVSTIVKLASEIITKDLASARTKARVQHLDNITLNMKEKNLLSSMPKLSCNGILSASAMACLSAMDIQVTISKLNNATKNKDMSILNLLHSKYNSFTSISSKKVSELSITSLLTTGRGEISGIDYLMYFLPNIPNKDKLIPSIDRNNEINELSHKWSSLSLCPSIIRQVALESYVQQTISLFNHLLDLKDTNKDELQNLEIISLLSSVIEVIVLVITYDKCKLVKLAAANLLINSLQNIQMSSIVWNFLSFGDKYQCDGFTNIMKKTKFTDDDFKNNKKNKIIEVIENNNSSRIKNHLQISIDNLWEVISVGCILDQNVRSILLKSWLFIFHKTNMDNNTTSSSIYLNDEGYECNLYNDLISKERLQVINPINSSKKIEMGLRYGNDYVSNPNAVETTKARPKVSKSKRASSSNMNEGFEKKSKNTANVDKDYY